MLLRSCTVVSGSDTAFLSVGLRLWQAHDVMAKVGFGVGGLGGSLVLLMLLGTSPARAQDAIPEDAKLYFQNGVELIQGQQPSYQDAYYQFKLAWERSKSWKVLSNWGLCALKLERDGEAIWAYTEYLKQNEIDPDERRDLERDLLLLNGNAASVTLASDVADLEIVDTRAGSAVPPQSYRLEAGKLGLRLRAGSHTLTASSQGKSLRWEVTLSPGHNEDHRFAFATPPVPAVAPPVAVATPAASTPLSPNRPPRDDAPTKSGGSVRTIGFVVAGAGILAVGGGALMGVSAKQQEKDSRNKCATLPLSGFTCPESTRGDFESAQQSARLANVLMIAGGAAAAGGLVMILVGGPRDRQRSARVELSVSPVVGARDAGLLAHGTF
jgi:hypothetical protein